MPPRYIVADTVQHLRRNGQRLGPGSSVALDESEAQPLLDVGAVLLVEEVAAPEEPAAPEDVAAVIALPSKLPTVPKLAAYLADKDPRFVRAMAASDTRASAARHYAARLEGTP